MTAPEPDPASFKDPDARVFHRAGRVFRVFRPAGARRYRAFLESGLSAALTDGGRIIESKVVDLPDAEGLAVEPGALAVEHPRLPFISYAYEWPFHMLRDAALLELELQREALARGFVLKDATPYNVQFVGARPVHIDVSSFEPWREGAPWTAYAQFCALFLNPLLFTAFRGVPFQPLLRGNLGGIPPETLSKLLPWRRKLGRSAFLDVTLQAWLNRKFSKDTGEAARLAGAARVRKEHLLATVERLSRTCGRLRPPRPESTWAGYEAEKSYSREGEEFKDRFVEAALRRSGPRVVWDLGCNTGRYSRIAARHAKHVVAMDSDPEVVDALYVRLREEGPRDSVLCLVMNLLDPSPGQGWGERERPGLDGRGRPDFCLALALAHHLVLSGNVPPDRFLDWLASRAPAGVVEFVPKSDPMARRLLQWREDVFETYTAEAFERELERRFRVIERAAVPGGDRLLYAVESRLSRGEEGGP